MRIVLLGATLLLVLATPTARAADCLAEDLYPNNTSIVEGNLRYVFGTTDTVYQVGSPVPMYLGAENIGAEPDTIHNPGILSPMDAWAIVDGSCQTLTQTCWDGRLFWSPEGVFFFGTPVILQPGECHSRTKVWDGLVGGVPAVEGIYAVMGGYFGGSWPYEFLQPAGGLRVEIGIDTAVPVESVTWGAIKRLLGT